MKKGYFFLVVLIVVGVLVGNVYEQNDKEFEILNSYKISANNFQNVTLQVVIYAWNYNEEEMLGKIKDFYYELNGIPDTIKINIYGSKRDFKKGIYKKQKVFLN